FMLMLAICVKNVATTHPPALEVGTNLIVGNEDADSAIAEVVEILDDVIYLRIKADLVPQLGK
ncbi:MAG: hypothetical protein ACKOEJ_08235, partial [Acidimicrobiaceae bacterium]